MTEIAACPVIAIDGPVGSGKGSVCYALAREFGWHLLDSGSLYRIIALAAKRQGISLKDEVKLVQLAEKLKVTFEVSDDEGLKILYNNHYVTQDIRSESIGIDASQLAILPKIRSSLLVYQRSQARLPGLIADGRDMGTLVFPEAALKVFLTASAEERGRRRYQQLRSKGSNVNMEQVLIDIKNRDRQDMERKYSPLIPHADAIVLDSTTLDINEVLQIITELAIERCIFLPDT